MKLTAAKCPNCNANIEVDRSLKFTKCEYCNTEVAVEEAIENLLQVELKNMPKLENHLKLGERHFKNGEFKEAYNQYSKAEELDPDNPIVILRKGLTKALTTNYNSFEINAAINGMKESYKIMKKMNMNKKEINQSIKETNSTIRLLRDFLEEVYNDNKMNQEQITGYIERLEDCLRGVEYLYSIQSGDKDLKVEILDNKIRILELLLTGSDNNSKSPKYQLNSTYQKELKEALESTKNERLTLDNKVVDKKVSSEKVVHVETKKSKVGNILCYIAELIIVIFFFDSIFGDHLYICSVIWFCCILLFLPKIKQLIIQRFGRKSGGLVIWLRVILVFAGIMAFSFLSTEDFEGTWISEEGKQFYLNSGNVVITEKDGTKITGTYYYEYNNVHYTIHVTTEEQEEIQLLYSPEEKNHKLCIKDEKKCIEYFDKRKDEKE